MVQNIAVRPMYVTIGEDIAQIQKIKCVADVTDSLVGKYFLYMDAAGVKKYVWIGKTATADPAPAGGWTGTKAVIVGGETATAIATLVATALTGTGFTAVASGDTVTLTHTAFGYAQPARDSETITATGFSFTMVKQGQKEKTAGCLKGDIQLTGFEQNKLEITCHAGGTTVQDERITGYSKPELSMVLQETDKQSLQEIMVMYGMPVFTPVGADKEAVFGYGPANVGGSNPKVKIRMHPVADDLTNKTNDWNIWKCELGLDSFNFSGESASEIPAKFTIYPDTTKPKGIQFFMVGDAVKAGY